MSRSVACWGTTAILVGSHSATNAEINTDACLSFEQKHPPIANLTLARARIIFNITPIEFICHIHLGCFVGE